MASKFGAAVTVDDPISDSSRFGASTIAPDEARPIDQAPDVSTEATIGQNILGGIEAAGVIASSAIAEPLAGLSGIRAAIIPGGQTGAEAVESTRERLAIKPTTPEAEAALVTFGDLIQRGIDIANIPIGGIAGIAELVTGQGIDRAVETVKAIQSSGVSKTLGERTFEETGSPAAAAFAESLPTAIGSAVGFKGTTKLPEAAAAVGRGIDIAEEVASGAIELVPQRTTPFTPKEKRTQSLISQIEEKASDVRTVGTGVEPRPKPTTLTGKLAEKLRVEGPDIVSRPLESEAVRQGIDKGIVATMKDASPQTKSAMLEMVQLKEKGLNQPLFGARNQPSQVVGKALMERINTIVSANKAAGKNIGRIAETKLRGQDIDILDASRQFDSDLDNLGISLVDDGKGGIKADYSNSVLPRGDRGAINEVIRVMNIKGKDGVDAEAAHDMKQIMDNHISFGKTKDGLSSQAEGVLSRYRAGLDDALDSKFPEYNTANTAYAETIEALNTFQEVAGKGVDISSPTAMKSAGQKMRVVLSNFASKQRLINSVDQIEDVANKYRASKPSRGGDRLIGGPASKTNKFDDDLLALTLFDNELDARFIPSSKGGLENLVTRKAQRAARAAASPVTAADVAVGVTGKVVEKVKGITDETAFKALADLLKSQN